MSGRSPAASAGTTFSFWPRPSKTRSSGFTPRRLRRHSGGFNNSCLTLGFPSPPAPLLSETPSGRTAFFSRPPNSAPVAASKGPATSSTCHAPCFRPTSLRSRPPADHIESGYRPMPRLFFLFPPGPACSRQFASEQAGPSGKKLPSAVTRETTRRCAGGSIDS